MWGFHKPPNQKETEFLQNLNCLIDFYTPVQENIITGFNMEKENHQFYEFVEMLALLCSINKPTYYQSKNPTCNNSFRLINKT